MIKGGIIALRARPRVKLTRRFNISKDPLFRYAIMKEDSPE